MKISKMTTMVTDTARPSPPPQTKTQPDALQGDFYESSKSLKRDALMAVSLLSPMALPPSAGMAVGGVIGGLGLLAGYGELREGMRNMNTREVIDGVLHMGASTAMLTSVVVSNPITAAVATGVGMTLLAAKRVVDRPKVAVEVALYEPFKMIRDSGISIYNERKDG